MKASCFHHRVVIFIHFCLLRGVNSCVYTKVAPKRKLKGHTEKYKSDAHHPTPVPEEVEKEHYVCPFPSELSRLYKTITLDLHIKAFLHNQEDFVALVFRGEN